MRSFSSFHRSRRTALQGLLGARALFAASGAGAGFNFFTSEYTASREELQARIDKRFPLTQRHGALFSVTLHDPRLGLDAQANRAAITTGVTIESALLAQPAVGTLTLSSALRYDPSTLALRLMEPTVEHIELQGMTGQRLQRIGAVVARELLEGEALHTFRPEELTVGRKTYEIGDITVRTDGITVQLK